MSAGLPPPEPPSEPSPPPNESKGSGKADLTFSFGGVPNERALVADWGGGQVALVLFRDGEWLVSAQRDSKVSAQTVFGTKGDIPVAVWASK